MNTSGIVVVGASAGGIQAIRNLVGSLSPKFPLPVCVVVHISPYSAGLLGEILDRSGPLRASNARDLERLYPGRIYVAPPAHHLIVGPGVLRLINGPRENWVRPAIDPLFRSAAQVYGPTTIGVVLTGNRHDGTQGLWAINGVGGTAIVQDPSDAEFPSMPRSALQFVDVDYCVRLSEMPSLPNRLASNEPEDGGDRSPSSLEA